MGKIDQDELDAVLLAWGSGTLISADGTSEVPEPFSLMLLSIAVAAGLEIQLVRRDNQGSLEVIK